MAQIDSLDVLAFGPHPDDVEFGCGGYLVTSARAGKRVGIIDMTEGEMSTNGTVAARLEEAQAAADIMGVVMRENLQLPNNYLYNSPEVQEKIVTAIRTYRPNTILIPYDYDRHPDHENASRLVREAVFTSGLIKYKTGDLAPHRPKHFYFYSLWCEFEPSFILDVTDVWDVKTQALLAHTSQFSTTKDTIPTIDTQDSTKLFWEARARHYGFKINASFGEPYKSVYFPIGIRNPDDLLPNLF